MRTAIQKEVYGVANIIAANNGDFNVSLSHTKTEDTTQCIADSDQVVSQVARVVCGTTSKEQMRFKRTFSLGLMEFKAW
jgi:hypothetical protein